MWEVLKFAVELKEMVSGGLASMANAANRHFTTIDNRVRGTQGVFNMAGKSVTDLNTRLNLLTQKRDLLIDTGDITRANREIQQLQDRINHLQNAGMRGGSGGSKGGFWGTVGAMGLGNIVAGGAMALGSMVIGQGSDVLKAGMEGSQTKAQYETMHGVPQGDALYGGLTKYIQDSIFGNELYGNATTMGAFGFQSDQIVPELKRLGDLSMGKKEWMDGLSLVYSQVKGSGKLQGQDWHQFINAGFNPLQVISEHTGRSMAKLMDDMGQGKITFDMVRQSILWATSEGGKYYKMLDNIGKTPFGKIQAAQGNIDNAKLQLGTALLPAISKLLDAMKPMIDGLPGFMDKIAPMGDKLIDGFMTLMPTLLDTGKSIAHALQPLTDLALSNDMRELTKGMLELTGLLAESLVPVLKGIVGIVKPVAGAAGQVLQGGVQGAKDIWHQAQDLVGARGWGPDGYKYPTWADKEADDRSPTWSHKALASLIDQYGGLKDWMNDDAERQSWRLNGKFAHPLPNVAAPSVATAPPVTPPKVQAPAGMQADPEASAAITGGGKRNVTLNFYRELVKQEIHTGGAAETFEVALEGFEEALLRVTENIAEGG